MCGIIGYIGKENAKPIFNKRAKALEYRGYDSAGIAALSQTTKVEVRKSVGQSKILEKSLANGSDFDGHLGIGHTRWATHGCPSR